MMKTMSSDAGLGKGVTALGHMEQQSCLAALARTLVQQRTGLRSFEALRKYERIAEEQMDVCRDTKPQQEKQGAAIPPTPLVVLPVVQPGPMLQPP